MLKYKGGERFEGKWRNNEVSGEGVWSVKVGTLYCADGTKREGVWRGNECVTELL